MTASTSAFSDSTGPPNKPPVDPPKHPPRTPPPPDNRPPTKPPQRGQLLPAPSQGHLPPARPTEVAVTRRPLAVATPGGPGQTTQRHLGEEPSPGSAVAAATAARESTGVVAGAGASFRLPPTPTVPSFDNGPRFTAGRERLYGHIGPPDTAEAEVMARLLKAAT